MTTNSYRGRRLGRCKPAVDTTAVVPNSRPQEATERPIEAPNDYGDRLLANRARCDARWHSRSNNLALLIIRVRQGSVALAERVRCGISEKLRLLVS